MDSIRNRMVPICYEQSLPNGPADTCAEFMATATEQYIKMIVGSVLAKTRSNLAGAAGALSINTHRYRQQLDQEEYALSKGEMSKGIINNLLPVETKEAISRRPLGLGDFRVAFEVGGSNAIGQFAPIVEGIMNGWPEGVLEGWGTHPDDIEEEEEELAHTGPALNGVPTNGAYANGVFASDNESYGWEGGTAKDRDNLFSLLDDCLTIGQ